MASIKDVAKKAGVSISTVSYVISGSRSVSQKTKDLVHRVMDEIGYRPHAVARALASRRSRILALILTPQERALGITELDLVTRASERAMERGYHLVLWSMGADQVKDLRELTAQGLAEGVILMEIRRKDPRVALLKDSGFPFEIIGRCCDDSEEVWHTDVDFRSTVRDAMSHLKELGHLRVALVNQSEEVFSSGYGPVVRIHDEIALAGQDLGMECHRFFSPPDPNGGYGTAAKLFEEHPENTALLVMNDEAVPGILRAVSDSGRRVPEDVSIMTLLSSSRFDEMMVPALTGMEVPVGDLMAHAVDSLVQRLEGEAIGTNGRLWPCRLKVRKSTAEPRNVVEHRDCDEKYS
jgi:DNA-binding LacI/PurR family transcriptional regulator